MAFSARNNTSTAVEVWASLPVTEGYAAPAGQHMRLAPYKQERVEMKVCGSAEAPARSAAAVAMRHRDVQLCAHSSGGSIVEWAEVHM